MTLSNPTPSELAVLRELIGSRYEQVADSSAGPGADTPSPPTSAIGGSPGALSGGDSVESPGPIQAAVPAASVERTTRPGGSHRRPRRRGGVWFLGGAAVVLVAVTIWSIGKISTGISETPHDAPLPAAQFNQQSIARSGGQAGAAGTAAGKAGAAGGHGSAPSGTGSGAGGREASRDTPAATSPSGAAPAPVAVGPRPQTPTGTSGADELDIPALNVSAPVANVDLITSSTPCPGSSDPIGNLCVPEHVSTVGQWTGSAALSGTTGSILIDGHVDNVGQGPGALHDLYQGQAGDLIYLTRGGVTTRWKVVALQVFPKDANHPDWYAGSAGARELHLVTCGGPLLTEPNGSHSYADNVAVTAIPD